MTKMELLLKNQRIRKAREMARLAKLKEEEAKEEKENEVHKAEEAEVEGSKREEILTVEAEAAEEAPKAKPATRKKGGRKPANREYMVMDRSIIEEEAGE